MDIKRGILMIDDIEKMDPLLSGRMDIKSGGLMINVIEKTGLLLSVRMGIKNGILTTLNSLKKNSYNGEKINVMGRSLRLMVGGTN
jgi:hypothetical protein